VLASRTGAGAERGEIRRARTRRSQATLCDEPCGNKAPLPPPRPSRSTRELDSRVTEGALTGERTPQNQETRRNASVGGEMEWCQVEENAREETPASGGGVSGRATTSKPYHARPRLETYRVRLRKKQRARSTSAVTALQRKPSKEKETIKRETRAPKVPLQGSPAIASRSSVDS
jgi:hypothetical protein